MKRESFLTKRATPSPRLVAAVALASSLASAGPTTTLRAKPTAATLYGRIQFVDAHPDVRVKVVTSGADLDVKRVRAFADGPGKWRIVDSFPDFRVQLVRSHPDLRVRFVSAFPGPRR